MEQITNHPQTTEEKKVRLRGKRSSWPMIVGLLLVLALIIWLVMLYADSLSSGLRAIVDVR